MSSGNNKLLIVTGAGASYDLVNPDASTVLSNRAYRPPLTKYIFKAPVGPTVKSGESSCISEILINHPYAAAVGSQYYINNSSGQDSRPLEKYLSDLKGSKYLTDQQRFWTVPLYLKGLFHAISQRYLPGGTNIATNYMSLLDKLKRSSYKDIVWMNMNYDLFADYALRVHLKEPEKLDDLDEYMNLETKDGLRIKYTKPHGSVDWVRKFKNKNIQGDDVRRGNAPEKFEEKLETKIYSKRGGKITGGDEDFTFPAISTPIGKYDFVCQEHKKEIEKALQEINAVLCIGFSALDEDILSVMRNIPLIQKLWIVNGDYDNGREVFVHIKTFGIKINECYGRDDNKGIYHSGFSSFIAKETIFGCEDKIF